MEKFQCHGKAMYMKGLDCAMVKLGRAYTEELGKKNYSDLEQWVPGCNT